jgi:hypothetical protein
MIRGCTITGAPIGHWTTAGGHIVWAEAGVVAMARPPSVKTPAVKLNKMRLMGNSSSLRETDQCLAFCWENDAEGMSCAAIASPVELLTALSFRDLTGGKFPVH